MAIVFQEESICMRVRVEQAVYTAVRDAMTHNQGVQEEVCSKLSEAVGIAVPAVHDACEEPAFEADVLAEKVCGLDKPMAQIDSSSRVVDVMEEEW